MTVTSISCGFTFIKQGTCLLVTNQDFQVLFIVYIISTTRSLFSDPYVIVSFDDVSIQSRVCKETVCPTWDQTLIIDTIRLYGDPDTILRSPPPIILEFFDKDDIVSLIEEL